MESRVSLSNTDSETVSETHTEPRRCLVPGTQLKSWHGGTCWHLLIFPAAERWETDLCEFIGQADGQISARSLARRWTDLRELLGQAAQPIGEILGHEASCVKQKVKGT